MPKKENKMENKIEIPGQVERSKAKINQIFLYDEVQKIIDERFDSKVSKSTLFNFLVLHFEGLVDLRNEKLNVYDIERIVEKRKK